MKKKKVIWRDGVNSYNKPLISCEVGQYKATIIFTGKRYEATTFKYSGDGRYAFHKDFGYSKSVNVLKKRIEELGIFTEHEQQRAPIILAQQRKATLAVETRAAEHRREIDPASLWWMNGQ